MNKKKQYYKPFFILVALLAVIGLGYQLGIVDYLTFENLKAQSSYLHKLVALHYLPSVLFFIIIYGFALAASLPIGGPLALIGGYLFGVILGTVYALLGSTLGAVSAFLLLRFLIGDEWRAYYYEKFSRFTTRVKEDGAWYLLTLNLLTVFPFFLINMVAILADISATTVLWTSALGTLPFNFVYSLAGSQLSTVTSPKDIWSYKIITVFILLALVALMPLVIKRIWFKKDSL